MAPHLLELCSPQFAQMQEQQGTSLLLTPAQGAWLSIQRMLAGAASEARYTPPNSPARLAVFNVVTSDAFEGGVMGLILCNVLMLAMAHFGMSTAWQVRGWGLLAVRWPAAKPQSCLCPGCPTWAQPWTPRPPDPYRPILQMATQQTDALRSHLVARTPGFPRMP